MLYSTHLIPSLIGMAGAWKDGRCLGHPHSCYSTLFWLGLAWLADEWGENETVKYRLKRIRMDSGGWHHHMWSPAYRFVQLHIPEMDTMHGWVSCIACADCAIIDWLIDRLIALLCWLCFPISDTDTCFVPSDGLIGWLMGECGLLVGMLRREKKREY